MSRKSGLGRGLGALIPSEYSDAMGEQTAESGSLLEVPHAALQPNRRQPREHFDEEALAGLTASIAEIGILQPILVHSVGEGRYEIIAGERRWRAAKRAGLQNVPVVVRDAESDEALLEQALVENLHRADLNPMEEAAAFQQLIEDFGLTQEQAAIRVGKSRAAVSNTLRLFQLPPAIQALVAEGQLSAGHARALLGTPDRGFQADLAQRVVADGLSVRETEEAVRRRLHGDEDPHPEPAPVGDPPKPTADSHPPRASAGAREPGFLELERLLSDLLDTRVSVSGASGRGRMIVEFADLADLERIYRTMTGD